MEQNNITIDDMNETIAIFDGWEFKAGDPKHKCPYCIGGDEPCTPAVDRFYKWGRVVFHYQLKYHTSWDALIPVVKKIKDHKQSCIHLPLNGVPDSVMPYIQAIQPMNRALIKADLQGVYNGVYQFILWYNKNKINGSIDSSASA